MNDFEETGLLVRGVEIGDRASYVDLFVPSHLTRTSQVPELKQNILRMFPSIVDHQCDNDRKVDFVEELTDTEIAHVFEHVLIEIIGQEDELAVSLKAQTIWNWRLNPRWTYQIEVDYANEDIFLRSVVKTAKVLREMIEYCTFVNPVS